MTVVLTDVGFRQEPRQIASALTERGIPFCLYTSLFFTRSSLAYRLAGFLPSARRQRVRDTLLRRSESDIDASCLRRLFFPDVLVRVIRLLHASQDALNLVVNVVFDRVVAHLISHDASVVVAMEGAALATVRRAHRLGLKAVVIANAPDILGEAVVVAREEVRLGLRRRASVGAAARRLALRTRLELAEADLVLANSEFTRDDLVAHGVSPGKIVALPLGVDLRLFTPRDRTQRQAGPFRVLYVGGIQPRKGVVYLAEAVATLQDAGLDCQLLACGHVDRRYLTALEGFVHSGALQLHAPVPHHLLESVYAAADAFVLPSLSDGFGLVAYEAMACGLPVIVSDRCGAMIEDGVNGLVVPHGDADALTAALRRLMDDPEFSARLAAGATDTARASTWSRYRESAAREIGALVGATPSVPLRTAPEATR